MVTTCEALVIGGGPAGAVAAALLARAGWSVIVLEHKEFPRRKVCGEYLSATNWPLLAELGLDDVVRRQAGPEVRRVGLFVGKHEIIADLPPLDDAGDRWGRALSRERLDTLLLSRAAELGAEVRQPWEARLLTPLGDRWLCRTQSLHGAATEDVAARVVIAAHGSWELGELPSQTPRLPARGSDLLGFKSHFREASLDAELMPLLSFPGGYGGLVHTDDGRISLSCCVRRDQLDRIPRSGESSAWEAVFKHLMDSTPAVRHVLEGATVDDRPLAAGPIRPGIRTGYQRGIFLVGNAAGEAHPVVAEGISMAMQSAWLLVERLAPQRAVIGDVTVQDSIGRDYARAWRSAFVRRIRVSSAVAQWAMRPALVAAFVPLLKRCPSLLTWGARRSGKADLVCA